MTPRLRQIAFVKELWDGGLLVDQDATAIIECIMRPAETWKDGKFDLIGALDKCGIVVRES